MAHGVDLDAFIGTSPDKPGFQYRPNMQDRAFPASHTSYESLFPSPSQRKVASNTVRRRTSRACDQCNLARTKCDGELPCNHCTECGLPCAYVRARKKRGKVSKKDMMERAAKNDTKTEDHEPRDQLTRPLNDTLYQVPASSTGGGLYAPRTSTTSSDMSMAKFRLQNVAQAPSLSNIDSGHGGGMSGLRQSPMMASGVGDILGDNFPGMDLDDLTGFDAFDQSPGYEMHHQMRTLNQAMYSIYPRYQLQEEMVDHRQQPNAPKSIGNFRYTDTRNSVTSPGGLSNESSHASASSQPHSNLKYPVLQEILPLLKPIMSQSLAYDLLEHYFASSFTSTPRPASPYLLGFVFSKQAFLRTINPRKSSPALLTSMLWLAAHTSDSSSLNSPPGARSRVCQKLLELTLTLLHPLVHRSKTSNIGSSIESNGDAREFNVLESSTSHEHAAQGTVDEVATYMHLAIVVSAGEAKGSSLRWWTAAWTLARELRLGQELPIDQRNTSRPCRNDGQEQPDEVDNSDEDSSRTLVISEREREERRRLWWLLYIIDRHLSLCYNSPIHLFDRDCEDLLRPMDEAEWQTGDFEAACVPSGLDPTDMNIRQRQSLSIFKFTGPSIFGYFVPLMAILGEIIGVVQASNHPMLGHLTRNTVTWDTHMHTVAQHLEEYRASLEDYLAQYVPDNVNGGATNGDSSTHLHQTEGQIEIKIAAAYGTHIMHVLYVLTTGRWDPIELLNDNEWISTSAFINATQHAIEGAAAAEEILVYDPELNFMPFLYGIYLLHGSFLLLVVADKMQVDAGSSAVKACQTMVRAHEACVVTLNTAYQRNFRKIMQSALAQVHGRMPASLVEQQRQRRREILGLYRWSGAGQGLAI